MLHHFTSFLSAHPPIHQEKLDLLCIAGQRNIERAELGLEYLLGEDPIANPHVERNEIPCEHASHRFPERFPEALLIIPGWLLGIFEPSTVVKSEDYLKGLSQKPGYDC